VLVNKLVVPWKFGDYDLGASFIYIIFNEIFSPVIVVFNINEHSIKECSNATINICVKKFNF